MTFKYKIISLIFLGIAIPFFTYAILDPDSTQSIFDLIERIYNFLFIIALPICVAVILWGTFTMATSGGDPAKNENAKKILTWAIIGLVIILISKGIVSVLDSIIGTKIPGVPK